MICQNCSSLNLGHARFCQECGFELSRSQMFSQTVPDPVQDISMDTDSWKKAAALKDKISVYQDTDLEAGTVAEIAPEEKFLIGEVIKNENKSWVPVMLADGKKGYIAGEEKILSEAGMAGDIGGWGTGLLIMGVISLLLSDFLDPIWGIVLIGAGIAALMVKKRFMFVVFGLVLLLAGIMNMTAGGGWMGFGVLQCIWGVSELVKYFSYSALDLPSDNLKTENL